MDIICNPNLKVKKFRQPSYSDKIVIETLIKEKISIRQIAKKINKTPSTVNRHVNRYLVLQNPSKAFNKKSNIWPNDQSQVQK